MLDFEKDTLVMVTENLRRPGGREPNPDPNAAPGSTIPTQPYIFSAKSQQHLLAVSNIVQYYQDTGRTLTAANIRYDPASDFDTQCIGYQKEENGGCHDFSKPIPEAIEALKLSLVTMKQGM